MKNYWRLFRCICLVVRYSLIISWIARKFGQRGGILNHYLHKAAEDILKTAEVDYQIHQHPALDFNRSEGYLFISNHESLFDLPLIFAAMQKNIRAIAKQELFRIPFFGKALEQAEFLPVDRNNPTNSARLFEIAQERLRKGTSIWMFAEGSRSRDGNLLPFKPGSFRFARETGATIIPTAILGTRRILPAKSSRLSLGQKVELRLGAPITTSAYTSHDAIKQLMNDTETAIRLLIQGSP